MDEFSGDDSDWEDELPLGVIRELEGFDLGSSLSSEDEDENRPLAHLAGVSDETVGDRRWVRVPKETPKNESLHDEIPSPGISATVDKTKTNRILDFFRLFFTLEFVSTLVEQTNTYADQRQKNNTEGAQPRAARRRGSR